MYYLNINNNVSRIIVLCKYSDTLVFPNVCDSTMGSLVIYLKILEVQSCLFILL